jgi:hypothetical protein
MAEPAAVIRWEEPPPGRPAGRETGNGNSRWNAVAAELRAHPGRWALIREGESGSGLATHIRQGHIACFTPAGDFDAVSRQARGVNRVYARYVGDPESTGVNP